MYLTITSTADSASDLGRPYAASSMLAVARGKVFRSAMAGRCEARPDLPGLALPLEIHVPALPSVGSRASSAPSSLRQGRGRSS